VILVASAGRDDLQVAASVGVGAMSMYDERAEGRATLVGLIGGVRDEG
jgi:hypothetical protein